MPKTTDARSDDPFMQAFLQVYETFPDTMRDSYFIDTFVGRVPGLSKPNFNAIKTRSGEDSPLRDWHILPLISGLKDAIETLNAVQSADEAAAVWDELTSYLPDLDTIQGQGAQRIARGFRAHWDYVRPDNQDRIEDAYAALYQPPSVDNERPPRIDMQAFGEVLRHFRTVTFHISADELAAITRWPDSFLAGIYLQEMEHALNQQTGKKSGLADKTIEQYERGEIARPYPETLPIIVTAVKSVIEHYQIPYEPEQWDRLVHHAFAVPLDSPLAAQPDAPRRTPLAQIDAKPLHEVLDHHRSMLEHKGVSSLRLARYLTKGEVVRPIAEEDEELNHVPSETRTGKRLTIYHEMAQIRRRKQDHPLVSGEQTRNVILGKYDLYGLRDAYLEAEIPLDEGRWSQFVAAFGFDPQEFPYDAYEGVSRETRQEHMPDRRIGTMLL